MTNLLFFLYPILYLSLGNIVRFIFLPYLNILFFQEIFNKRLFIKSKVFYFITFLIFFNILLFIINSVSLPKLGFHICQLFLILLFAGCSSEFANNCSNILKKSSYIIIGIVYLLFVLRLFNVDITDLLILFRFTEYKYILSSDDSTIRYMFLTGLEERISYGNPTNMGTFLWLVISIQSLFKSNTYTLAKIFLPITFITSSRIFNFTIISFLIGKFNFFKAFKFAKKLDLFIFFIFCFLLIIISFNLNFEKLNELILRIIRIENLDFNSFLLKESRRYFSYLSVFSDISNYIFLGGGPGNSYQYNLDLIGENVSTESTYLALILDYGLIPSLIMIYLFISESLKSDIISLPVLIIFLITGLFLPYFDELIFYIFLGMTLNPRLSNKKIEDFNQI